MNSTIYDLYELHRSYGHDIKKVYDDMARAEEEQLKALLQSVEAKRLVRHFKKEVQSEMERRSYIEQVDILNLGIKIGMEIQKNFCARDEDIFLKRED